MNRLAPILLVAAGPITGPLALGLISCLKAGRWVMAGVYGTAIIETWGLLAAVAQHLPASLKALVS